MRLLILLSLFFCQPLTAAPPSLDRVVVIGASVSRGFTETEPFGGEKSNQLRFDRYLDAALIAPHGKIINDANHLLFMNADEQGARQLERLKKRKPTLVVGIDFLFWFLYGYPEKTGDRLELFDRGLEQLSAIDVPLVVGDIPDASAAIGNMLVKAMVPDKETLAEANRRLNSWAEKRNNVAILPLGSFMSATRKDARIQVGKCTWQDGETKALLQPDQLHPNPAGCSALAIATLAALEQLGLPESSVRWDPAAIQKAAAE